MAAAEKTQLVVIERLHTDTDTIHARLQVAVDLVRHDVARVRLDRHLRVRSEPEAGSTGIEDARQPRRREQTGRAPAEEEAVRLAARSRLDMTDHCFDVGIDQPEVTRLLVEVAVRT